MSYKYISSRQVDNAAALPNIGSPAFDSLDDILLKINNALGGLTTATGYIAKKASLTSNTTSLVVTIPAQPDTSYIILGMMGNEIDSFPQFQQIEITAKSTTGFTFSWNHPLDTGNYFISYVVPFKVFPEVEASIGSGANTLSSTLPIAQPFSGYGVITQLQNITDTNPEFQDIVIDTNTNSVVNLKWNAVTDTNNYLATYMIGATGQTSISNSSTSVTVNLPVNYGSSNYAVIASIQNGTDAHPQFQPMIITAQGNQSFTLSWNNVRDTGNYLVNYYAISLTQ